MLFLEKAGERHERESGPPPENVVDESSVHSPRLNGNTKRTMKQQVNAVFPPGVCDYASDS